MSTASEKQAARFADAIRVLLRTFTVDETQFPPAEGRMKYNALDFQTLHFLSQTPGSTGAALARFLGVSPTTAQSVTDRLIKRGLLARDANPSSGRAISLSLTKQGEDMQAAIERQDIANCQTMLATLPASDRRHFVDQLDQITRAVGAGPDGQNS
ncbi:AtsB [Candidatus Phaeomarinobacter ectocarpi]|uniref:AtsB n=1 Tax=Candidatus Phaeomarinibacter ectocarpi TaxID=1458461 RepID=X5MFX8_9HYPH|nr:MarR family winged helix-turn-helix transcriptional regulator [Candidatus Phaeomarinobacter ectocarpi]CDO60254.1 AtsB [Candidatus Phaeomarinobacter ectocarpi]